MVDFFRSWGKTTVINAGAMLYRRYFQFPGHYRDLRILSLEKSIILPAMLLLPCCDGAHAHAHVLIIQRRLVVDMANRIKSGQAEALPANLSAAARSDMVSFLTSIPVQSLLWVSIERLIYGDLNMDGLRNASHSHYRTECRPEGDFRHKP